MRHILGAVVAGGLILGLAAPSRAQFQLNIGNPYGGYGNGYGGYGNGIRFGGGAYNYSPYNNAYGSPYGYGATAYGTRYYNSGYSGYVPPVVNYAPIYRPVAPMYRGYGYGRGYGRGYRRF